MILNVKDKVIIITGSSNGIGKDLAIKFADLGAKVVINGRNPEKINKTLEIIQKKGYEALAFQANLRSHEEAVKMVEQTKAHFGRIDVLINNAGGSFTAPAEDITPNGWNAIIETNLNTAFFCSKEVCKVMRDQSQGGKIINMSSVAGFLPDVHHAPYSAAKAGLNLLTETLAVEWAKYNITVNAIAPGFIETEGLKLQGHTDTAAIPLRRFGQTNDVFGAALFLVSDLSNYITGETIRVDGGMRGAMRM
jgi:NAD(P)-dependent dehydrogenase (short-subunit alcohol dehydrogenase family)